MDAGDTGEMNHMSNSNHKDTIEFRNTMVARVTRDISNTKDTLNIRNTMNNRYTLGIRSNGPTASINCITSPTWRSEHCKTMATRF